MKSTYVQKKSEQSIDKRFIQDEFQGYEWMSFTKSKAGYFVYNKRQMNLFEVKPLL